MNMNKRKILALAVTSAFAGTAMAQSTVNLDSTATQGITMASETTSVANIPVILNVNAAVGWGFSASTAIYVRYDLGNSGTFVTAPTSLAANEPLGAATTGATTTLSSGGTSGTSNAIYQITANASGSNSTANLALVLGNASIRSNATGALTITQTVYDTAANAVSGGATGRLVAPKTANLVNFTPAYTFSVTQGTAQTADVNATAGAYKGFTGGASVGTVVLGVVNLANGSAALSNNGLTATANSVLATTSRLTVTGDFTGAANANGTYTGAALSKVFLSNTACTGTSNVNANSLTATTATFPINNALSTANATAGNNTLCITAEGNTAVPAATYTAQYTPVGNTGYTNVTASSAATIGSIARNGGQLTSPWFSTASGYISRFVLTNSGSTAATYTVSVAAETGNTATLVPAGQTGTVPAGGMLVVNATDIVSAFSGAARASVTFTFQTGRTNVNGVYQVTSPTGGVMATTLVTPGTN